LRINGRFKGFKNKNPQNHYDLKGLVRLASIWSLKNPNTYWKCLFENALPEPDFKYFSNAKALYLLKKVIVNNTETGRRVRVNFI